VVHASLVKQPLLINLVVHASLIRPHAPPALKEAAGDLFAAPVKEAPD